MASLGGFMADDRITYTATTGFDKPPEDPRLSPDDLERLDKAATKRIRKAAKKAGLKG